MRVRPVAATGVTRYTKRAMKLGGCYLPAGTMIAVPFYAVCLLLTRALSLGLLCLLTGQSGIPPLQMLASRSEEAACRYTAGIDGCCMCRSITTPVIGKIPMRSSR